MAPCMLRRLLKLPVLRFVDDFFAIEQEGLERESMMIFARSVCMACDSECCAAFAPPGWSGAY